MNHARFFGRQSLSFLATLIFVAGLFFTIGVNFDGFLFTDWMSQNESPLETTWPSPIHEPVFFGTPNPEPVATISAQNADKIEQLAYFGKGEVKDAVYSADGDLLAVASSIGVYILDVQTLEQVSFINVKGFEHCRHQPRRADGGFSFR